TPRPCSAERPWQTCRRPEGSSASPPSPHILIQQMKLVVVGGGIVAVRAFMSRHTASHVGAGGPRLATRARRARAQVGGLARPSVRCRGRGGALDRRHTPREA